MHNLAIQSAVWKGTDDLIRFIDIELQALGISLPKDVIEEFLKKIENNALNYFLLSDKEQKKFFDKTFKQVINTYHFSLLEDQIPLNEFSDASKELLSSVFTKVKNSTKHICPSLDLQLWVLTQYLISTYNDQVNLETLIDFDLIKNLFIEVNPITQKAIIHWGNTAKSKKEQHELIKNEFAYLVEDYLLLSVLSETEEDINLASYIDFLKDIEKDLASFYRLAYVQVLEDRAALKSWVKNNTTTKQTSSASNFYSPVSWSGSLKQFDSVQKWQIDTIKKRINQLTLEEDKKVELIRLLIRLKKNGKPFQKADFFGDTPKRFPIGPQNEEKLLSLVAQLGLEIKEIPLQECVENTSDQLSSLLLEKSSPEKTSSDLEIVDTDNPDAIVAFLKGLWYGFENEDKFKKDLEIFSANCLTKNAVLNKLTNKEFMLNKVIAKWKWAFVIELWEQERILLSKSNGNFIIVDFFRDHKDYDAALSLFKWG